MLDSPSNYDKYAFKLITCVFVSRLSFLLPFSYEKVSIKTLSENYSPLTPWCVTISLENNPFN